ncbi:MAG: glycosyl transferase family 2 [Sulfobacillus thermosulfidooxidans]|nr:MAG: glycosyl transferase family 2 [Sulfobacillus thermosulfidooxidans]
MAPNTAWVPQQQLVSVVIPAKNEAGRIGEAIYTIDAIFQAADMAVEIIVVDDASSDDTSTEARRAADVVHSPVHVLKTHTSTGKGHAIMCGFQASRGDVVAFIDADLEYPAELLPAMVELIGKDYDQCVIACREHDERPWFERQTSRLAHWLASKVLQLPVKDTQAGMKVFPGWFARDVLTKAREPGWLYDIEALMKARRHNLRIIEVPVNQRSVRPRRAGLNHMVACVPSLGKMAWAHLSHVFHRVWEDRWQLLRFGVVGSLNTGVDIAVFWMFMSIWPPFHNGFLAALESLGAWIVASICGYILHSRVSFRTPLPAFGFYVVTSLGVAVQMTLSGLSSHVLGNTGALLGKVAGIAVASMVTYTGYHILARRSHSLLGVEQPLHSRT